MKPTTVRLAGVHAPGLPDTGRVRTNGDDPPTPEKETAAPAGPRNGGNRGGKLSRVSEGQNSPKGLPAASRYVRMPIVNDDLHVVGHDWIKIGAALGAYLRKMVTEGGAR